jgi:hypothetical protein
VSPSRALAAIVVALSLASCTAPRGPWPEDFLPRLSGPRLPADLAEESWGLPVMLDDRDLPRHIWAYDTGARIWHDRERDTYVAWDSTHEVWIRLTPERAALEFSPARARLVPTDRDEPWKPEACEPRRSE